MGDIIILGETGAQILVAAELVQHFEQSLTQVGSILPPKTQMHRQAPLQCPSDPVCSARTDRHAELVAPELMKHFERFLPHMRLSGLVTS